MKTLVIDDGALIDCIRNYPAIHDEGDKGYKIPLRKTIPGKKLQTETRQPEHGGDRSKVVAGSLWLCGNQASICEICFTHY